MEARTEFEQSCNPAADNHLSRLRPCQSRNKTEQCAFSGSVAPDDRHAFPVLQPERDILQSIKRICSSPPEEILYMSLQQTGLYTVPEAFRDIYEFDHAW